MGFLALFRAWRARRRPQQEAERITWELTQLANDLGVTPQLISLRNNLWALTAPGYRPVVAGSPGEALRKFRTLRCRS